MNGFITVFIPLQIINVIILNSSSSHQTLVNFTVDYVVAFHTFFFIICCTNTLSVILHCICSEVNKITKKLPPRFLECTSVSYHYTHFKPLVRQTKAKVRCSWGRSNLFTLTGLKETSWEINAWSRVHQKIGIWQSKRRNRYYFALSYSPQRMIKLLISISLSWDHSRTQLFKDCCCRANWDNHKHILNGKINITPDIFWYHMFLVQGKGNLPVPTDNLTKNMQI